MSEFTELGLLVKPEDMCLFEGEAEQCFKPNPESAEELAQKMKEANLTFWWWGLDEPRDVSKANSTSSPVNQSKYGSLTNFERQMLATPQAANKVLVLMPSIGERKSHTLIPTGSNWVTVVEMAKAQGLEGVENVDLNMTGLRLVTHGGPDKASFMARVEEEGFTAMAYGTYMKQELVLVPGKPGEVYISWVQLVAGPWIEEYTAKNHLYGVGSGKAIQGNLSALRTFWNLLFREVEIMQGVSFREAEEKIVISLTAHQHTPYLNFGNYASDPISPENTDKAANGTEFFAIVE